MSDSTITVVGTLTRDPELRFGNGGGAVAGIGVAVNHRYQKNGEWVEDASFFNATCFSSLAENVAASLTKGMRVIVSGRLQQRSYETQQGEKRSVVEIVADEVGPSLRWATTQVEKVKREGGQSSGGRPTGQRQQSKPVYTDEEPF